MRRDADRAAKILVDAAAIGDRKAAEKWKVSERTIRNYRVALKKDANLAASYRENATEADRSWHLIRNRFLRDVTEHLRELCLSASSEQIADVRAAIKDIGELDLAREALGVGTGDHREGATSSKDAGGGVAEDGDEGSSDPGTVAGPRAMDS